MSRVEALVVGGGPIGLAAAIALRLRGVEVEVVDPRRPPVDKACGEGVMPDGVSWLESRGVRLARASCAPFRGIRYVDGDRIADGHFADGHGLGVRRTELHRALADRAEELGARLEWGVRALAIDGRRVATTVGTKEARWLIGADVLGSEVRQWAGLEGSTLRRRRVRTGIRRHYRVAPWGDRVEVHWGRRSEAYVTPVSASETGVALLQTGRARGFDDAVREFPALEERLRHAEATSTDRGSGPFRRRARAVHTGRIALLGDAAGYLDAITGEGLSLGFHQAESLADAIVAGNLALYGKAFRGLVALPFLLIRVLLMAERHPSLRRRLFDTLAHEPELFTRILAIHARQQPPFSLGWDGALRLVRGMCAPGAARA